MRRDRNATGASGLQYYSIQITIYEASGGWYLDFTSNYPLTKVVVKGANHSYTYIYDPVVLSDTLLYAPVNASGTYPNPSHTDLHVYFCGPTPPVPELPVGLLSAFGLVGIGALVLVTKHGKAVTAK